MFKISYPNHAPNIRILCYKEPTRVFPYHCLTTEDVSGEKPWYFDIKRYIEKQEYPEGTTICDKQTLRRLASKFLLSRDALYKRNYDSVLLRCVDRHEEESSYEKSTRALLGLMPVDIPWPRKSYERVISG